MKNIWTILCSNTSVDQKTNNISLFNILEQINVESKVFDLAKKEKKNIKAIIPFQMVVLWVKEGSEGKINYEQKTEIVDPKGNVLSSAINSWQIPENQFRMRIVLSFDGLPITMPGEYIFRVLLKTEKEKNFSEKSIIPLIVKQT